MVITYAAEIFATARGIGYSQIILLDVIKLFSVLCLFCVFIVNKKVKALLWKRYKEFENDNVSNDKVMA